MINLEAIQKQVETFKSASPFPHIILDDFVDQAIAEKLSAEFPNIDDSSLFSYSNPLEKKSALNDWNKFPPATYKFFEFLQHHLF